MQLSNWIQNTNRRWNNQKSNHQRRICQSDKRIQNSCGKSIHRFYFGGIFFKHNAVARVHSYLNTMYKYAGKEIDIMIEHFTNTAVYAVVIEDIIETTVSKFH